MREEIIGEYMPRGSSVHSHEVIDYMQLQRSTTLLNKLQILPLPHRTGPDAAVMGCVNYSSNE